MKRGHVDTANADELRAKPSDPVSITDLHTIDRAMGISPKHSYAVERPFLCDAGWEGKPVMELFA
jgi:hypothetical protein